MPIGNVKQKITWILAFSVVAGIVTVGAILVSDRLQAIPVGLEYNGTQAFSAGRHEVTIETISHGEDGPAEVVVSGDNFRHVLNSRCNRDLYMDVRPAYVSHQDVDGIRGRELLIWKPDGATDMKLTASEYVSSSDGKLHALNPPLELGQ